MAEDIIHCTYTEDTKVQITKEGVKDVLHTAYDDTGLFFPPGDMLVGALGACMLTLMSVIAKRYNQKLDGTKVAIKPLFDPNGGGLQKVKVDITFRADIKEDLRRRYLAAVQNCPVHKSLRQDIIFTVTHN